MNILDKTKFYVLIQENYVSPNETGDVIIILEHNGSYYGNSSIKKYSAYNLTKNIFLNSCLDMYLKEL